jgi:hypothetical protein
MTMIVDSILDAMRAEIAKYSLELLQRYPDDLLVHDRRMLSQFAVPGAQIAWMVGHSHTHLVRLGISEKENQGVRYLTNLGSADRFYVLSIRSHGDAFVLSEISRHAFEALGSVRVAYAREGGVTAFWLLRDGVRVGSVSLESVGNLAQPHYKAMITPSYGISPLDRAALDLWCEQSIIEAARTLFVRYDVTVCNPLRLPLAA